MKILMLNNEFPPLGGGTGTVNLELFKEFSKIPNLKIDLITSTIKNKKEIEQFSENIRIFKYPVGNKNIHHSTNKELIIYMRKSFFAALKLHKKEKYDFAFAWSTVPAGFVAYLLQFFKRLPFVVRVGGPDIPGFEERYKNLYKIISPIIKLIWRKSNLLITKCATEKELIEKINNKLKIKITHNGIDTQKFKPDKNNHQKIQNIVCSARLIKRKGQDLLIRAVANLKKEGINYNVNLIGEGDEKENYKKLAENLGVSENIKFSGYVKRENMPAQYQNADLFVLPSYNEGMSNALLEAMASGLPVIVTDVGGTEELVDETNGFIFKTGDDIDLTLILKDIAENKNMIKNMSENSRQKAEQLSWKNIANDYNLLFNKLIKSK